MLDKLSYRQQTGLQRSLMVLLLLVCAYYAVLILMQITKTHSGLKDLPRSPQAAVISWNWFRSGTFVVESVDESHGELPEADINAVLLGVMIAGDNSFATLKFNGKPEAVYHQGDDLSSGYELVAIETYRIVVRKNGLNQQVLMKKPESIIETEVVEAEVPLQQPTEGFALANMFGAVPVSAGGSAGLKLNNLSSAITSIADVQEGDVVIAIDGTSVQELISNPAQWVKFSSSSNLPVTVMRNNQEQIIYVNAASLAAKVLPNIGMER